MVGTWHILTQVEWFNILKTEHNCHKVEMNYPYKVNRKLKQLYNKQFIIDVYGENKDNIFMIEIGNISLDKLKYLKSLRLNNPQIKFIYIPYPTKKPIKIRHFKKCFTCRKRFMPSNSNTKYCLNHRIN